MNGQTKLVILVAAWIGGSYWIASDEGPQAVGFTLFITALFFLFLTGLALMGIQLMGASDLVRNWIAGQFGYRVKRDAVTWETRWVKIGEDE